MRNWIDNPTMRVSRAANGLIGPNTRYGTDYISEKALKILNMNSTDGLVYEHIVPKTKFINNTCEHMAMAGNVSIESIFEVLDKYLWTATITSSENRLLPTARNMPSGWDGINIFARYESANISLLAHDKTYLFASNSAQ